MVCGWCWYFGIAFDSHFLILFICLQEKMSPTIMRLDLDWHACPHTSLGFLRQHATFDDAEKIKKIKIHSNNTRQELMENWKVGRSLGKAIGRWWIAMFLPSIFLAEYYVKSKMKGAHLKSGWINKALIFHSDSFNHQTKPSNVDAGWGPKCFCFYRDIWRSSNVPTYSFLPIEIYTICYLAICNCS